MQRPKKNKQAGEAFKKLLEEKSFTQYKLVQVTGLDQGLISRLANGYTASPKVATLERIAGALEVDLGELTKIFTQSAMRSHSAEVSLPQEEVIANSTSEEETREPLCLRLEALTERVRAWQLEQESQNQQLDALVGITSDDPNFVGRGKAIAHLDSLINEGAKVILIQGEGGIGKTTLAKEWFERQGLKHLLELDVGTTRQTIYPAEDWVKQTLRSYFDENPEQNFRAMLEQLKHKLQTQRIGVLIDNLEVALFNGEFIKPNENYIELLRVLAHSTVRSVTLVTSQELLHEPGVMSFQTVKNYPKLEALDLEAWGKYFNTHKITVDIKALSEMHQAYGGNALAMSLLSSDIRKESQGNLEAYWQQNRNDFLRHRSIENLIQRQFNKLNADNFQAHELLCRFGFYPNRNFPVPKVWLFCLLWDVPEKRRQRVIDDLCDRSLVKFGDDGYYLHPVIRTEAVDRLKLVDESSRVHLLLIKEQIDLLLAQHRKIQDALSWISQRFSLVSEGYKKAAFRAFYLGEILENHHFYYLSLGEANFKCFEIASVLDRKFRLICHEIAHQEGEELASYIEIKVYTEATRIFQANPKKYFNNINKVIEKAQEEVIEEAYQFYINNPNKYNKHAKDIKDTAGIQFELMICLDSQEEEIISLKKTDQLDIVKEKFIKNFTNTFYSSINKAIIETTRSEFVNMLNGKIKADKTKNISRVIEVYKYNLCPNFSQEQEKLLQQYSEVNLLLLYCLDEASDTVRSHIEDTLLLPIKSDRSV